MKFLEQKLGHFWWKQNVRTTVYIIREMSGVLIALFALSPVFIYGASYAGWEIPVEIVRIVIYLGLVGAVIHTVTWLYVMPQLLPFKLSKLQQKFVYLLFLALWIGISYLLLMSVF